MKRFFNQSELFERRIFYVVASVILVFRFCIGATTEIVGGQYDTDGLAYLVNMGYWGHSQDPIRPPFMPLVGWLVMKMGVPYRLFLEVFFLASIFWVSKLVRREFGGVVAIAVLFFVVFNPYTIRSFTEGQREPLLFVLYIVAFGLLLRIFSKIRRDESSYMSLAAISVTLAFIILTREGEELFVAVILCVSAGFVFCYFRRALRSKWFVVVFFALIPLVVLLKATSLLNLHYFGVDGYRGLFGYQTKLLDQLHRIRAEDALRYAPVTNSTFQVASEKSRKFSEFGSAVLARDGFYELLREHSSSFVGAKEIDPTRTIWALNKALDDKYGSDGGLKALKLKGATEELAELLETNALPSAKFPLPYPFDPNFSHWIEYVPSTVLMLLKETIFLSGDFAGLGARSDFNPANFDSAFDRRTTLVDRQFGGRMHSIREFFVENYPLILLAGCFVLVLLPAGEVGLAAGVWVMVISACLLSRLLVTSILFASVAPVNRYMVFSAPLFAIWMPLCLVLLRSKVSIFINSAGRSSEGRSISV